MEKIRVLHIFGPNFKRRFGGPIFDWKYAFSKWDEAAVEHLVLTENGVEPATEAFNFDMIANQVMSTRSDRTTWIFTLLFSLNRHKKKYDLIHFHVLLWGGLLAAAWAKLNKIPTIYQSVLQGSDTPGAIKQQRFGNLKLSLLKKFTLIVAISNQLRQDYLDFSFPKENVAMLMNSVDTDLFHPLESQKGKQSIREKYSLRQTDRILIFTGSIIERKGVDLLIQVFLQIAHDHPDLYLWLVGPVSKDENASLDEEFVLKMKSQVSRAGMNERVRFHGMISDRGDLAEAYQAADIFVFPSRKEGLPNVVLEAMSSGLLVIVSDLPGLKGVVAPGENGVVVPIGDAGALAAAISDILSNNSVLPRLGRNARSYIESVHGFDAWQNEMTSCYHKLMKSVTESTD